MPATARPVNSSPFTRALIPLAVVGISSSAGAGGLEVGDTGAEALGRGGAFVAKADNPATINYNPAGFVKLRGHHIAVGGNVVHAAHSFTRAGQLDPGGSTPYPTVDNAAPWLAAPRHLMITSDLGLFDRVTVAAGLYVPPATGSVYPEQIEVGTRQVSAPQRYTALETSGVILFPSVGVAFRPTDWLDVGLSFQWVVTQVKATQIGTVGLVCDQVEDPQCDVRVRLEVADNFSPTGSAGILLRPKENLELGAMARFPSKARLEGKASITLGPALQKLEGGLIVPMITPLDPEVSMDNAYPWMVRAGARYVFRRGGEELADIEADLIWENWSAVSQRTVLIKGQSMGKEMEPQQIDWKLKDTIALRLGGSYRVRLSPAWALILRTGLFAETASTGVSDTSLSVFGPKRLGLTGGIGVRWGRFQVDAAYAHLFFPKRVVGQSTVTAQDFGGEVGPVVGNGTYTAAVDIVSLQLSVAFGAGAAPATTHRPTQPIVPEQPDPEPALPPDSDPFTDEDEDPEPLRQPTELDDDLGFSVRRPAAARPRAQRPRATQGALEFNPDGITENADATPSSEPPTTIPSSPRVHRGAPRGATRPLRGHPRYRRGNRATGARIRKLRLRRAARQARRALRARWPAAPASACLRRDLAGRCLKVKRWYLLKLKRRPSRTTLVAR